MNELIELGEKYRAMKLIYTKRDAQVTSRLACENLYPEYLKRFRNETFNLLELGIGYGGSLRMWRDYFPNASIFGLDIDPECCFEEDRIKTWAGSQDDIEFLLQMMREINSVSIIIDDAGHTPTAQVASLEALFPFLTPGGLYVIEDLHLSYDKARKGGGLKNPESSVEYLKKKVDLTVLGTSDIEYIHFYKNIVFIKKNG